MAQGTHLSEPRVYAEAEAGFSKPSSGRGYPTGDLNGHVASRRPKGTGGNFRLKAGLRQG